MFIFKGLVLVVAGLYLSSNEQDKNRFQEPLLPGYSSEVYQFTLAS